jgi:hypothetical protein
VKRAALAVAAVVAASSASAHMRFPTVRAERWIELRLEESPIGIGYRIGFGAELAKEQRKLADLDRDGEVSASEGNAALDRKTADLLAHLRICTGRSAQELECATLERRAVEQVEVDGWVPDAAGHLHFAWTLRLPADAARLGALRVEDDWQLAGVEITDVRIVPPSHAPLTAAGEGPSPSGVASGFTWIEARRGTGPRVVAAAWPAKPRPSGVLIGLALASLAIGVVVWLRSRRRIARAAG